MTPDTIFPPHEEPRRVALLFDSVAGYEQGVLQGIRRAAVPSMGWVIRWVNCSERSVQEIASWRPHGVIGLFSDDLRYRRLLDLHIPIVNAARWQETQGTASVAVDDHQVGRLAAEHLLERGLPHYAYLAGYPSIFNQHRRAGFAETITKAGFQCHMGDGVAVEPNRSLSDVLGGTSELMARWIVTLPKPVGILAVNDHNGLCLVETCLEAGFRVPDDVAIVGVDNVELYCSMARVPLSSVEQPLEQIGLESARLLDRMMAGEPPPRSPILLPPIGVVTRASSDRMAIGDEYVAQAMRYIRDNVSKRVTVQDLPEVLLISRRALELRFRRSLGHGPQEEIRRSRIEYARKLLAETDWDIPAVASKSGFVSASRFSVDYRRATGMTPTEYRRQYRMPHAG